MGREKVEKVRKLKVIVLMTFVLGLIPFAIAEEGYYHVLTLESPDPENHAWYGLRVKICGDIIAVTEPNANVEDIVDAGKVYLYDLEGNLLSTLQSPTPGEVDVFGDRFDIYENLIIIQEPGCYVNDLHEAGRAHVFSTSTPLNHQNQDEEDSMDLQAYTKTLSLFTRTKTRELYTYIIKKENT
jgi:hypothetical protein